MGHLGFMARTRALASSPRAQQLAHPKGLHGRPYSMKNEQAAERLSHRELGVKQELFTMSKYSPGSPIFLPAGTIVFNRLVNFLRKQYVGYGFQEVITPSMYKKSLWKTSGHLANFGNDMYSIKNSSSGRDSCCDGEHATNGDEAEEFALKPMNCPGHCLIFKSKFRSYRDLPIRYADFGTLHRNEASGALTGMTRLRGFHQDDGHIFCRPCQVEQEISKTLGFVKTVYSALNLGVSYHLLLSTRPENHWIGAVEEWDRAENSLKRALDESGMEWSTNPGQGAFYGPKIDIVLKDVMDKEHQTATIQLDFQMPKLFELEYHAPAPDVEARGEETEDAELRAQYGPVQPVMIHRAVLGSVERLMAILMENFQEKWPFWLNAKQVIILTLNTTAPVVDWARESRDVLLGMKPDTQTAHGIEGIVNPTGLQVDLDITSRSLGAKIREARIRGYGEIIVVGNDEVANKQISLRCGEERMSPQEVRERLLAKVDRME
ncbi:hypothetical protein CDD81_76 [Ophiocordyceps australis]|uniref:threonine--tRNA ligase n=1 Tax=Ophiocordyceps australis TaxID=1399860 RepID=A0A2C5YJX7_9HYPO|nr:hypothetical protein CDD81_76 [Ophiocordyceps australis]